MLHLLKMIQFQHLDIVDEYYLAYVWRIEKL